MAISGKMPPVSYLTWLDRYTLWNFGLIIAMALQSRCLSQFAPDPRDEAEGGLYDYICMGILAGTWCAVHIWYFYRAFQLWYRGSRKVRDAHLMSGISFLAEKAKHVKVSQSLV